MNRSIIRASAAMKIQLVFIMFLLPLLPCLAADLPPTEQWQSYMHDGVNKWDNGDFEAGEADVSAALSEAEEKHLPIAYIDLSLSRLMIMLPALGKYDEAEKLYRRMLEMHPETNCQFSLATLLDKEGKFDKDLYRKCKSLPSLDDVSPAVGRYMRQLQEAIRSHWRLALQGVKRPGSVGANETVVDMQVNSEGVGAAYVLDSSRDAALDKAAIEAVQQFEPPIYDPNLPPWVEVKFTFNYNIILQPPPRSNIGFGSAPPASHDDRLKRDEAYRKITNLQQLLAWQEQHLGKHHVEIPISVTEFGVALEKIQEPAKAEKTFRIAMDQWSKLNIDCIQRAGTCDALAHLLEKNRRYEEAVKLRQQSLAILDQRARPCSFGLRERMRKIAIDLTRLKRTDEAKSYQQKLADCLPTTAPLIKAVPAATNP